MAQNQNSPHGLKAPGWEMSYADHVSASEAEMLKFMQIHRTCECPKGVHQHQRTAFACKHVIEQDPIRPNGIVRMPKGYFLCQHCVGLLERHRLQFVHEVATTCSACVWDEIYRIMQISPDKFQDRAIPGTLEDPAPIKA